MTFMLVILGRDTTLRVNQAGMPLLIAYLSIHSLAPVTVGPTEHSRSLSMGNPNSSPALGKLLKAYEYCLSGPAASHLFNLSSL
jgi:hypothetical protein